MAMGKTLLVAVLLLLTGFGGPSSAHSATKLKPKAAVKAKTQTPKRIQRYLPAELFEAVSFRISDDFNSDRRIWVGHYGKDPGDPAPLLFLEPSPEFLTQSRYDKISTAVTNTAEEIFDPVKNEYRLRFEIILCSDHYFDMGKKVLLAAKSGAFANATLRQWPATTMQAVLVNTATDETIGEPVTVKVADRNSLPVTVTLSAADFDRFVVLTDQSLLSMRFDFISEAVEGALRAQTWRVSKDAITALDAKLASREGGIDRPITQEDASEAEQILRANLSMQETIRGNSPPEQVLKPEVPLQMIQHLHDRLFEVRKLSELTEENPSRAKIAEYLQAMITRTRSSNQVEAQTIETKDGRKVAVDQAGTEAVGMAYGIVFGAKGDIKRAKEELESITKQYGTMKIEQIDDQHLRVHDIAVTVRRHATDEADVIISYMSVIERPDSTETRESPSRFVKLPGATHIPAWLSEAPPAP